MFLIVRAISLVAAVGLAGLGVWGAPAAHAQGAGYWHTSGAQILDAGNQPVRIAGVNWYGFETTQEVAHGLTTQDYKSILNTVHTLGYNTVRIPFSNQMVETPGTNLNVGYYYNFGPINTDLQGLNSLQVLDKIVAYAGTIGLKIILDNHRSEAGNSAEANGLWYTGSYPESAWLADWQALATRYAGNPTVIGFDLRNEPHNAYAGGSCWDCGSLTNDWHLAAERAGNAVLAINPSLLIFVEGTDAYNNDYYWWGGQLEGVANSPVTLSVANRLVYSAHDYGPNEYGQSWFSGDSQASLNAVWTAHWGYISQQGTAPVWLGEFGTENSDADVAGTASGSQGLWFESLVGYLQAHPSLNWTYWALNGEDTYGLLDADYDPTPVDQLKQLYLTTIQSPLSGGTTPVTPPGAPSLLTATAVSSSQINLAWKASATAGATYTVYFGTTANSIATVLTSGLTSTSYQATSLNPSTSYFFDVVAVASGSSSGTSNSASAMTQAAPVTAAPAGLQATAVSSTQINLAWSASATTGATYSVYSGNSPGAVTSLVASGLGATSYAVSGLSASTTYYFTVTATASATGTSAASNTASATTQAVPLPAAPTNVQATAMSSSQIYVTWTASTTAGATYTVYNGAVQLASGLTGTSYQVTGLSASTSYTFTVTASENGQTSAASNAATAKTQAAPAPSAPSNLTATAVSSSQINLAWTASPTAGVTYSIFSGTTQIASGVSATSYSATGLSASTSYSFTVTAVAGATSAAAGSSPASNPASATTQAATVTAPAAPFGLTASPTSASQINLYWQPSTTANVTYTVYSGTAAGVTGTVVASGLSATTLAVTGLLDDTTYFFSVKAVVSGVASAASNQASATTQTLPSTTPTGLTATAVSATQINLTWNAVPNTGVTYAVFYGTSTGSENTALASGITGTAYQATGLTPGTTYYFIVRSISPGGTSAPSTQASATTQVTGVPVVPVTPTQPTAPTAPTGLTASAASSTQINLAWAPSSTSGVTYNVYTGSSAGSIGTLVVSGQVGTGYAVTGLTPNTTYFYAVTAVNSAGTSPASNAASAITQAPAVPAAPTGVQATATSSTQINVTWTASASASSTAGLTYSVFSGTAPGAETNQVASGLTATYFAATGLTASTTYYYVVKAVSGSGSSSSTSAASNEASASTQAAAGGACHVDYQDQNDWNTGFTGLVAITNTSTTPMTSWTVTWTYGGSQQIYTSWNGTYSQNGQKVSIANASWNGTIAPGATLSGIGWNANYTGTNTNPTAFYVNGVLCK
jgi:endoglucanase